jgi:hypothetical protein
MMPFNKKFLIVATVAISFALAACGGGGGSSGSTTSVPNNLTILADGITLRSMSATSTGLTQISNASIPSTPSATLAADHQIFGLVIDPSKRWVYAASESAGWGNARINRFAIDWTNGNLTYVDAFLLTAGSGPVCADSDSCAPVGLGITPDGSRLIVQESRDYNFLTFAIAANGSLSYVNSAPAGDRLHGVGINADGTYLYNGSEAYSLTGNTVTDLNNSGQRGNASVVKKINGVDRLYTTLNVSDVGVFDLTDPAAPVSLATPINPDPLGRTHLMIWLSIRMDRE